MREKFLKRINGGTNFGNVWLHKFNRKLMELYGELVIIWVIKDQRFRHNVPVNRRVTKTK